MANMSGMGSWLGMGQTAPCPSVEQLQGINDPLDPCQAANAGTPIVQPGTTMSPTTLAMVVGGMLLAVVMISKKG